jgi:hypothetical protein
MIRRSGDPAGNDIYILYPGCTKSFQFNGTNGSYFNIGGGDNLKEAASSPD